MQTTTADPVLSDSLYNQWEETGTSGTQFKIFYGQLHNKMNCAVTFTNYSDQIYYLGLH